MSRLYNLRYKRADRPAYVEDAGHLLKLTGMLYQGMSEDFLLLMPTAAPVEDLQIVKPSLDEWCAILKQTDDPVFFKENQEWNPKAIVRKQQRAISGAVQQKVWVRDEFTCMYCGRKMGDVQLSVDHFIPLEMDGENNMENYISACRKCNREKGCIPPEKYCNDNGLDYEGLKAYLKEGLPRYFIAHLG